ncbi:MAG: T9SS type A sorting domain-containing protein [Melioribacteraceae bacterium]|nr:T9SS type A sorting domain-containing protein [Melioribacteraceae bacterium]MCF8264631.1 T9SS type A sorting domain-containing protein [Melioribacteraceae bacterium]
MKLTRYLMVFFLTLFLISEANIAKGVKGERRSGTAALQKADGSPVYTHFNINQISTWIKNNGETDINPNGNSGLVYPKGSNQQAVFQSGLVWGGKIGGEIRVGGSTYRQGLLPGAVVGSGATIDREDDAAAHVRIYRVRPDWAEGNVQAEMNDEGVSAAEVRAQYEKDWNEWPASYGAPYEDVDGNGSYNADTDIPGFPGSDQTVWFVANDVDQAQALFIYGSNPIGLEMQATAWGYNSNGALGNMFFRKFTVINYSGQDISEMYFCWWSDPDVGGAGDDFVGCDTTLSLSYCFNGGASDAQYGNTPPAVGFDFFQGPIVAGTAADTAVFNNAKVPGMKNLGMSAHFFFINSDPVYTDPSLGDYQEGTLQMYNLFEGKVSTTGVPFTDPTNGKQTAFALAGDPITNQGWVDGILHSPGDRRLGLVSGPFNMTAGETQEVVIAEIAAGAFGNVDRLGAVSLLKFYDREAQATYDNFFNVPSSPTRPAVTIDEFDREILLSWYQDDATVKATESHNDLGFEFQGYVIYQYPSASASPQDARIVATYDIVDGKGKIVGDDFDTDGGVVVPQVLKFGSDSGIKRSISITTDMFTAGQSLNNGTPYYFGVTAYAVHEDPLNVPLVLENSHEIIEAIPQTPAPGNRISYETSTGLFASQTSGSANATVEYNIVNPTETTGHDYKVWFNEQHYYFGTDGEWHFTNYPDSIGKGLSKDLAGSSLTGQSYVTGATTRDLVFTFNLAASFYSYCDGVKLIFPSGIQVLGSEPSGASGNTPGVYSSVDNSVTWGSPDTSLNGPFHGGEMLTVSVAANFTLPLTLDFEAYDDGWGAAYAPYYGASDSLAHTTGQVVITEEAYFFKTEQHWNLRDETLGVDVLEDQLLLSPSDIDKASSPIVDGMQVYVTGNYEAPINFLSVSLNEESSTTFSTTYGFADPGIVLTNYTVFGGVVTSWAIDNFGVGTTEIDQLQQDYEIRYTGVFDGGTTINGATVYQVIEGGSMATCFRAVSGGALATHPLNPSPGTAAPFLMRVPFEVWNVADPDNPYQVNVTFRDRERDGTEDPFYSWNLDSRMYVLFVNTPYDPTQVIQVDGGPDALNADATWVMVFKKSNYAVGDVVTVQYANPIQLGKDEFTFSVDAPVYSVELEKADVKDINVFPNPYYGFNSNEINKYQRFVTFNHLPEKAVLRIFNLAGQLVKTIQKDDPSQFQKWDLTNESGLPAASGLYIAYIEMPDLGETKILKFGVIQEQQVLDRF